MADTTALNQAEKWVTSNYLPKQFKGIKFSSQKLELKWGGKFAFDAVSNDKKIVGLVSTSSAKTASGKSAIAKYQKLKADALYLLNVKKAKRLLMIFTDKSMVEHFNKEKKSGRFPLEIEFLYAALPYRIKTRVLAARKKASAETTPLSK